MGLHSIVQTLGNPSIYMGSDEGFANEGVMGGSSGEDAHHASIVTVLVAILVMVLQIIIIAIFGMYVWNGVIAGKNGLLPFVNEATSIWQLIGLFLVVQILHM